MVNSSRKKLRRWSFAIECEGKGFSLPVIAFGNNSNANQIANHIAKDYKALDQLNGKEFIVHKIPHETISLTTKQQLDGLEFELKIMSKVVGLLKDHVNPDVPESDKEWNEFVGHLVVKARAELLNEVYPDKEQLSGIKAHLAKQIESNDDYKMPLGLEAIKEALHGSKE